MGMEKSQNLKLAIGSSEVKREKQQKGRESIGPDLAFVKLREDETYQVRKRRGWSRENTVTGNTARRADEEER